jgi:hypothetical protein
VNVSINQASQHQHISQLFHLPLPEEAHTHLSLLIMDRKSSKPQTCKTIALEKKKKKSQHDEPPI